ncbi:MAG: helix-turn-helix domain-containing protein [Halobacteriales archaeon]|nr:helix-turn-helix domain-containing protein [Halobacteriales archaeon]
MSTIEQLGPQQVVEPSSEPEFIHLEDAGPVLEALASETARAIVAELQDEPATATEIAERIDTSLQNVSYHLSDLKETTLVTDVGTRYSEKGREMTVYASEATALVIGASRDYGLPK